MSWDDKNSPPQQAQQYPSQQPSGYPQQQPYGYPYYPPPRRNTGLIAGVIIGVVAVVISLLLVFIMFNPFAHPGGSAGGSGGTTPEIVGSWHITKLVEEGNGTYYYSRDFYLQFNSNGTGIYCYLTQNGTNSEKFWFTWEDLGNHEMKIISGYTDLRRGVTYEYTVDGSSIEISGSSAYSGVVDTYYGERVDGLPCI